MDLEVSDDDTEVYSVEFYHASTGSLPVTFTHVSNHLRYNDDESVVEHISIFDFDSGSAGAIASDFFSTDDWSNIVCSSYVAEHSEPCATSYAE